MKSAIKSTIAIAATTAAVAGVAALPSLVSAWGDNYVDPVTGAKGRPSYTTAEINGGAIGKACKKDDEACKADPAYPGKVVFNSISDSEPIGGSEKNFVGARECVLRDDKRCEGDNKTNIWNNNDINVEDGKTYIIRMYVHNNNPNGTDAVAENTHVSFSIPSTVGKQVQVNGFIDSSNATPSEYWDYVNFNSADVPFHLEYVYGSALLENNSIGLGGLTLSDDVVKSKSGGTLIGYDALDGRIPGCYQYANYVTIQVKAVFDYDYTVDKKVRLADSEDRTWKESVDAQIGDKVEFRIEYKNTSDKQQNGVTIKDVLPANLKYISGTTILRNSSHPTGAVMTHDYLVTDGTKIGNYGAGANAYIYFAAEVVNDNLACGDNTLINWAQAGVGSKTIQDSASVKVNRYCKDEPTPTPTPTPTPETPSKLPTTGPEAIVGGVIATGSIVTAAGYYIASRRQLR